MSCWYMKRRLAEESNAKGSDVTVATPVVDVDEKPVEEKKVSKKKKKED